MSVQLGAHVGQQEFTMDEQRSLWRWLDSNGFDWISAWDHIYEAPPEGGTLDHYEAVATLAAMAVETVNARLGCLVFYVGYRNPGLLAKAAVTIDHLSGGRFELGLGAGWHKWEAEAYGYDFPRAGTRLDMLAEAAEIITDLISPSERTNFAGDHFRVENASCLPGPVYGSMPIWIGGVGEKRTLPITARWADGWNAAYISPEEFQRLNGVLSGACEDIGRDPNEIERSINLMFGVGVDEQSAAKNLTDLRTRWGSMADRVDGGALVGTPEQAIERLGAYVEAGATLINIALRQPYDPEALLAYHEVVMPAVRQLG